MPAFQPLVLTMKGSLYLTRPSLAHYVATREELVASTGALFSSDPVRGGASDSRIVLARRGSRAHATSRSTHDLTYVLTP